MADIKTITVSNTQYNVKDETARTTKQDKTDNTLATTAKTVVGAINELNNKFPVVSTNMSSAGQVANKVLVTDGANGYNYQNVPIIVTNTVTIAVSDWSGGTTCTKSVSGVTTSNTVITDSSDNTVTATAQGSGTLTFSATATPTAAVTVKVAVLG